MGKMQREKGKTFERKIADILRQRWPSAIVRRASQAERADNPDVFVEGVPILERLWLELQDSRTPTPEGKLAQAERDACAYYCARGIGPALWGDPRLRLPVVVWHKTGSRTTWATCRIHTLDDVRSLNLRSTQPNETIVTLELEALLWMLNVRSDADRAAKAQHAEAFAAVEAAP